MRVLAAGVSALLAFALGSCSSSDDEARSAATSADPSEARIELSQTGGCGEAFFWAATASGDVAVTVEVDARDRPSKRPTRVRTSLPSEVASVRVLRGTNVAENLCTDDIDASATTSTASAVAGELRIVLDPPAACDPTSVVGRMDLVELVAADGTAFGPISVSTNEIGCVAG